MLEEVQSILEHNPSFDSDFKQNQQMETNDPNRDMTNLVKELEIRLSQYSLNQIKDTEESKLDTNIEL